MQKKLLPLCWLLLCCIPATMVSGQASEKIHRFEYFFDADPGFGNGSIANVSPAVAAVNSFTFSPNINALTNGLHLLYVRAVDSLYRTSETVPKLFYKEAVTTATVSPITQAEYFIDTDPRFGNATPAAVTSGGTVSFAIATGIGSLSTGMHILFVRVKNAQGNWSQTSQTLLYKEPAVNNPTPNVVAAEYFFDVDPGFGNGLAATVTPGQVVSFGFSNSIAALSNGLHYLYVRTKDANGKWSVTTPQLFYKEPAVSNPVPNIVSAEYFFDTDPGFGNGTPYNFATPGTNVSQVLNLSAAGLTKGFHRLYMRAKDTKGNWSLINAPVFYYETLIPPTSIGNLQYIEWFWNTDPGFGNANRLALPAGNAGQVTDFVFNATGISGFTNSTQNFYVRLVGDNWSETTVRLVDFTGVVLPVTLLEFTAKAQGSTAMTSWKTSQEINALRYEVEHSTDALQFTKIGSVNAAGNSNTQQAYNFEHLQPAQGINYYRLKQIDNDGRFTYSAVIRLLFNNGKTGPVAFPNPVADQLTVMVPVAFASSKHTIAFMDAKGTLMLQQRVTGISNYMNVAKYPAGNYVITISNDKGAVIWQQRMVKIK